MFINVSYSKFHLSEIARPSSPVRQVRRAPDHFFGRPWYPPYHFFSIAAAVLTCLCSSNHFILNESRLIDEIIINARKSCHQGKGVKTNITGITKRVKTLRSFK